MINNIEDFKYNRDMLIGRPNLTLKDIQCKNIMCKKTDKFKKYKDGLYLCECGYIYIGNPKIEITHRIKLYCKVISCPYNKTKMDKNCLSCEFIGER